MNIPNLPTDNLYKFIALTGIVLIVSGYVIVWPHALRSRELARELKQLEVSVREIKEEADLINAKARLVAIQEELKLIFELQPRFMAFWYASQYVGLTVTIVGFFLWYTRVQRYQDMILKRQASQTQGDQKGG